MFEKNLIWLLGFKWWKSYYKSNVEKQHRLDREIDILIKRFKYSKVEYSRI